MGKRLISDRELLGVTPRKGRGPLTDKSIKKFWGFEKISIIEKDTHFSSCKTLLCPRWIGAGSKYRTGE